MAGGVSLVEDDRFLKETGLAGEIAAVVSPVLAELGFRLVRVHVSGRNGVTVQIMAERPDGTITIDDCATISRNVSPVLEAYDKVQGSYHLEVSSPGIDRPLVRASDFASWAGHEARIELKQLYEGRRKLRGRLVGGNEDEVAVEIEGEPPSAGPQNVRVPIGLVHSARLVLSDDLIAEDLRRNAKRRAEAEARLLKDNSD